MESKEALKRIRREAGTPYFSTLYDIDMWREDFKTIEKDLDKLEQLEDVQKKLGIDLKVYHKLMDMLYCDEPNILYVKDKYEIIQVGILEIDYCKKKIIFYEDKNYNDDYIYGFWQYGKIWALTKEELENE